MSKELERLKEGPKGEIRIDLRKLTLDKYKPGKRRFHDGIHGFWFKKFTSIYDRLALEMKGCVQGAHVSEWMTKGKTKLIQKRTQAKELLYTTTDP